MYVLLSILPSDGGGVIDTSKKLVLWGYRFPVRKTAINKGNLDCRQLQQPRRNENASEIQHQLSPISCGFFFSPSPFRFSRSKSQRMRELGFVFGFFLSHCCTHLRISHNHSKTCRGSVRLLLYMTGILVYIKPAEILPQMQRHRKTHHINPDAGEAIGSNADPGAAYIF